MCPGAASWPRPSHRSTRFHPCFFLASVLKLLTSKGPIHILGNLFAKMWSNPKTLSSAPWQWQMLLCADFSWGWVTGPFPHTHTPQHFCFFPPTLHRYLKEGTFAGSLFSPSQAMPTAQESKADKTSWRLQGMVWEAFGVGWVNKSHISCGLVSWKAFLG